MGELSELSKLSDLSSPFWEMSKLMDKGEFGEMAELSD